MTPRRALLPQIRSRPKSGSGTRRKSGWRISFSMMRQLAPLALLLVLAGPVQAATGTPNDGGIVVDARADDHGRGMVWASVDIAAPPAVVFRIISTAPARLA